MATFLFVHGAFVGGWSWKKVTALLRAAGHEVYTPTLTGLGERVHLLNPDIGLETHIQDILEVISYEDLAGVILVGHSYSGLVIASVADRIPHRPLCHDHSTSGTYTVTARTGVALHLEPTHRRNLLPRRERVRRLRVR
jgi:pimeloyl-ACP methyl ester carboxylesterase